MKKINILLLGSLITAHISHAQRALREEDLSYNPDVTIKKNDKDTSVNRKDNKTKGFFYKHETAFYRKDYTKFYKGL
jgi:hypothetical protein